MADKEQYYCNGSCKRMLKADNFYKSNNLEKYGANDGRLFQCKKCTTMYVDNWDPKTFTPILKECDVPYLPEIWNDLLRRYGKDPTKMTGTSVIGRYLGTMRLKKWNDYRWADSEFLQETERAKKKANLESQGLSAAEITQEIEKSEQIPEKPEILKDDGDTTPRPYIVTTVEDSELGLTEDDVNYLKIIWGETYRPTEWLKLEQLWVEMCDSYDIQTAGEKNGLKMICKASLKAHQLIDLGDIDGFQKMSKAYDLLMKQNKFTAAQNKEDDDENQSIGELIRLCEEDGFIPQYYVTEPQDKIDENIADIKNYIRRLVEEETNLSELVQQSLTAIEKDKESFTDDFVLDVDELEEKQEEKKFDDFMSGYQINLENFEPLDKQEEVTAEEEESSAAMQEMLDIIEKVKETEEKTVDNEKDNEDESDTSAIVFSQDNQELYDKFFKD
jgi:hypothetical protein